MATVTETTEVKKFLPKALTLGTIAVLQGVVAYQSATKAGMTKKFSAIGSIVGGLVTFGLLWVVSMPITENIEKKVTIRN